MSFRNCFHLLTLIVSYSLYGQNTVSIFNSTDSKLGWNGRYNNKLIQNGIYTYKLLFNRKSTTGTITVMGEK